MCLGKEAGTLERLKTARRKVIGSKETVKHLERGDVHLVYVAQDAEERVVEAVLRLAAEKAVEVVRCPSMLELGKAAGIKVGAAAVAVLEY